CARQLTFDFW
nr:immunoglobulin heavy chain junction region [Mus musculus]